MRDTAGEVRTDLKEIYSYERPPRTYIQQLCVATQYSLKDLPGAMDDRDGWREKVREIRAVSST